MALHQIVRASRGQSQGHTHIERVRLDDGTELTTSQVVSSMLDGHSYFTISLKTGGRIGVRPYKCRKCDRWWIRSRSD